MTDTPRVSVVISTRDRADSVVASARGVLSNDYPDFELWIVDQSADDRTRRSVSALLGDSRVHYVRCDARGLSNGLNFGIAKTRGEIVAITGDDCMVPANWLTALVGVFATDPRIGVVFGNVLPGPHDRTKGFVPGYVRSHPEVARTVREKHRLGGTSACMGIRRGVWVALDGFDPLLGVGARFHSAEDVDFAMRALSSGCHVREDPEVQVVHRGFYSWDERGALLHCYWYGTGAAMTKQLRCGRWTAVLVLLQLARGWVFSRSRVAKSIGGGPFRLRGARAFVLGSISGALTPLDRSRGHYVES